jgi:hypothetical protein
VEFLSTALAEGLKLVADTLGVFKVVTSMLEDLSADLKIPERHLCEGTLASLALPLEQLLERRLRQPRGRLQAATAASPQEQGHPERHLQRHLRPERPNRPSQQLQRWRLKRRHNCHNRVLLRLQLAFLVQ